MIGWGRYRDDWVYIIDQVGDEYLINWGGPVWVDASELTNIRLIGGKVS